VRTLRHGALRVARWLWFGSEGARMLWVRRIASSASCCSSRCRYPDGCLPLPAPPTTPLATATWLAEGRIHKTWRPIEEISPRSSAPPSAPRMPISVPIKASIGRHQEGDARNEHGRRLRGASTISQQTAKNVFLTRTATGCARGSRTYLTVMIEALWPKRRILEILPQRGAVRSGYSAPKRPPNITSTSLRPG